MYHQLIYLLDLCTYCYQLHNQTLIWPMDPYYDQLSGIKGRRNGFMDEVHRRASSGHYVGLRGPDVLTDSQTHQTNQDLDPILSDYRNINPWKPSVVRPNRETEGWILYNTPNQITDRISEAWVVRYIAGNPRSVTNPPFPINIPRPTLRQTGTDWLYCFEGGTGAISRKTTHAAWSLMGFVLAREDETAPNPPPGRPYDLYIVFRGSRSGDPRALRALTEERGNPDWVTDMDFGAGRGVVGNIPEISETGNVSPGFAASMSTMLPTVMACLKISRIEKHTHLERYMLPDTAWQLHWRCILQVQCCWEVRMATPYRREMAAKCRMTSGGGHGAAHNWFRLRSPSSETSPFRTLLT